MSLMVDHFVRIEWIACPLCHTREEKPFFDVEDTTGWMPQKHYRLVRCLRCDLVYLNPRPVEEEAAKFYETDRYLPFVSSHGRELTGLEKWYARLRRWNSRWKRKQIEKFHRKGRILDVGCGTGEFLHEMVTHGWEGRGVERDPDAVHHAIETLKLRVYAGSIETMPTAAASFDVVTMWHVLEHLYAPHRALQKVRDLLTPGGVLVIAVPNVQSIDAKAYRRRWVALDLPRHVQFFNLKSLRMLCEMHKFSFMAVKNLPLDSLFNAWMSEHGNKQRLWLRPLAYLRAGLIAQAALLCGWLKPGKTRFLGSTLLTFWKKDQ